MRRIRWSWKHTSDADGRVQDYRILSGGDNGEGVLAELKNMLIFTTFHPATSFGRPTAGRAILTFSKIQVKGWISETENNNCLLRQRVTRFSEADLRDATSTRKLEDVDSLPNSFQEALLSSSFRSPLLALLVAALTSAAAAQNRATLDVSETLFSVVSAINVCGYDHELQSSSPIRREVRAQLLEASKSPSVAKAAGDMCEFYHDHKAGDGAHDLAQYVSLALNLGNPPDFTPKAQEADMPPDAIFVLGFVPLLSSTTRRLICIKSGCSTSPNTPT